MQIKCVELWIFYNQIIITVWQNEDYVKIKINTSAIGFQIGYSLRVAVRWLNRWAEKICWSLICVSWISTSLLVRNYYIYLFYEEVFFRCKKHCKRFAVCEFLYHYCIYRPNFWPLRTKKGLPLSREVGSFENNLNRKIQSYLLGCFSPKTFCKVVVSKDTKKLKNRQVHWFSTAHVT